MKKLLYLLLLTGCSLYKSPNPYATENGCKLIINKERGTKIEECDFNKNGISEEIRFFKKREGGYELRYIYYDNDEDGLPDITTLGSSQKNMEFYFMSYSKRNLK